MMSETQFVDGPALSPSADLVAWFEGDGAGKLVQLPVVVTPSPLGLASGHVGVLPEPPGADALLLKLDDTAMGVSLADKIRGDCPAGQACVIWVEGIWGATVAMPDMPAMPSMDGPGGPAATDKHPFSVRGYAGKVEGEPTHIRVTGG
ncbi:MAG: hypothetical protein JRI25_10180 [Deltaproteobacteria bacterium]|nr:hypothetical protein [Deltaproteobacteria bacterium]